MDNPSCPVDRPGWMDVIVRVCRQILEVDDWYQVLMTLRDFLNTCLPLLGS